MVPFFSDVPVNGTISVGFAPFCSTADSMSAALVSAPSRQLGLIFIMIGENEGLSISSDERNVASNTGHETQASERQKSRDREVNTCVQIYNMSTYYTN